MSEDQNHLERENAQLKLEVTNLQAKLASMLDTAHDLRSSVTFASSYSKLIQNRSLDPDLLSEALSQIEKHSAESVRLITLMQGCGYRDDNET